MNFELNETQRDIKDAAREFFSKELPGAVVRRVSESDTAFDRDLWRKCADQGYTGMIFPERYGGVGLGFVELAVMLEEMGRALLPGPFISTVLFAGSLLDACASDAQKHALLAPICGGDIRATVALLEKSASWDRASIRMTASESGGGVEFTGEKCFVADAGIADFMIVAARAVGELVLAIVPSDAPGITTTLTPGMDLTRRQHHVIFSAVHIPADRVLARGAAAEAALDRAVDVTAVGLSAEMVGGMQFLLDHTVSYVKTRSQFGKPIGSYQAVQHRCVDMFALVEGARSATYYAAYALGHNDPQASLAVSVAKAYASDAFRDVGNMAIQAQGGMGFTWENDTHLYYRRAKGSELMCGDATFHRDRVGRVLVR